MPSTLTDQEPMKECHPGITSISFLLEESQVGIAKNDSPPATLCTSRVPRYRSLKTPKMADFRHITSEQKGKYQVLGYQA